MKLAIIGAGNMGQAMYRRLSDSLGVENVWLCDHHAEKLKSATQASTDLAAILPKVDALMFALKPQSFALWNVKVPDHLILSIMTGITLHTLSEKTGANKVVRSMPNLALQLGCSLTGWIASGHVRAAEKKFAHSIFASFGKEFEVKQEGQLDALTAVSGSGPAYFLFLCSTLAKKAEEYGFSEEEARAIVLETLKGASALLERAEGQSEKLVSAITSKGGTTQAALNAFKEGEVERYFSKGVDAAKKRAEELSV